MARKIVLSYEFLVLNLSVCRSSLVLCSLYFNVIVSLPLHASADYRLGEFDAFTVGLKYGRKLDSGNEWSARVELYSADGSVPADLLIGNQGDREIYPDTTAIIAQFSYSFGW